VAYKLFAEKYTVKITSIKNKESAEDIVKELSNSDFIVSSVKEASACKIRRLRL
jgi:hypothetical protein